MQRKLFALVLILLLLVGCNNDISSNAVVDNEEQITEHESFEIDSNTESEIKNTPCIICGYGRMSAEHIVLWNLRDNFQNNISLILSKSYTCHDEDFNSIDSILEIFDRDNEGMGNIHPMELSITENYNNSDFHGIYTLVNVVKQLYKDAINDGYTQDGRCFTIIKNVDTVNLKTFLDEDTDTLELMFEGDICLSACLADYDGGENDEWHETIPFKMKVTYDRTHEGFNFQLVATSMELFEYKVAD